MNFLDVMTIISDLSWIPVAIAIVFVLVIVSVCVIDCRERKAKQQEEVEEELISEQATLGDGPIINVLCIDAETSEHYRLLVALKHVKSLVEEPETGKVFLMFKTSTIEDGRFVPKHVLCAESYEEVEEKIKAAKKEWKHEETL